MKSSWLHRPILALFASSIPLAMAMAYSVQPMVYTMTPQGPGATTRLSVVNSRQGLLNVELEPYSVTADEAGKRTFTPAPDDFLIFPPQASVPGDKTQLFQVRYIGPPALAKGRVYILRVRQTNTIEVTGNATDSAQTKLALALNFNTTAIVQPKQLTPKVEIERDVTPDATGVLHARIVNRGDGVADLSRYQWGLDRGGKSEALTMQNIKYGDAVFLEPGHSRDLTLSAEIKGPARLTVTSVGDDRGDRRN
jgi:fimbrial chaperone protein